MTILRDLVNFAALIIGAIFTTGAICGAGTVLIIAGLWDKWDRAKA